MSSERIFDYSSFEGRLERNVRKFKNWAWLILPIAALAVFVLGLAVLTPSDLSPEDAPILESAALKATPVPMLFKSGPMKSRLSVSTTDQSPSPCPTLPPTPAPSPGDASNLKNGTFLFRPLGENPTVLHNYSGLYAGLNEIQKVYLTKLEINNVIIDGPLLSQRLQNTPNLEIIILDQIGLAGNFTPVYLPKLKHFYFEQFRNAPTDDHKIAEALKKSLFFRLKENQDWDLTKDVLNLGVTIKYVVSGSTILEVDRAQGLVNINSHECEDYYRNIDPALGNVTRLAVHWCTVNDPNLLPLKTLKYINLNNAVPEKTILSNVLRGAEQLEEFHAFLPYACDNASYISSEYPEIMIFINLTDFSDTIRTVSLSKLAVYPMAEDYVSPITDLTLETVNVTGILPNFSKNFANLTKVAIFNSTSDSDGYGLLEEILKTNAKWILMASFNRNSTFTECEALLSQLGIGKSDRDFIIEKDEAGVVTGRSISAFERHYNRYNLLAFKDIDGYEIYTAWDAKYK